MQKKLLLIFGGLFGVFIVIGIIAAIANPDTQKSVNEGQKQARELVEGQKSTPTPTPTPTATPTPTPTATPTPEPTKEEAILSGKDETGKVVIFDINIWQKPGSGGRDNVAVGTVPDNTTVQVLENKTVDGVLFYRIESSVGKVSVLPTSFELREKAMADRPKSEWFVDADPSFPVEGWVADSYVTNLK